MNRSAHGDSRRGAFRQVGIGSASPGATARRAFVLDCTAEGKRVQMTDWRPRHRQHSAAAAAVVEARR